MASDHSPDDPPRVALAEAGVTSGLAANARIPHAALERVLARAVELQGTNEELTEGLSEERLVEIAREVGIDVTNLRQAMAEERARLPFTEPDRGFLLEAFGPGVTSAQRTVPGTPAEINAKIEAWMPRMELLTMRRRIGDRTSWESRRDAFGNFLRGIGVGGRRLDLVRADQVSTMVTRVDDMRSVVRFDVEMHGVRRTQRTAFVAGAIGLGAAFMVLSVPIWLLALGPAVPAAVLTLGALLGGTGFAMWRAMRRNYRRVMDRAHLRIEQLLDDLERGGLQPKQGLLGQVRDVLLGKP